MKASAFAYARTTGVANALERLAVHGIADKSETRVTGAHNHVQQQ